MNRKVSSPNQIVSTITNQMYANTKFEHNETQPIYLLHRDTIRSFFHEKINLFGLAGKLSTSFGLFLSCGTTLLTSTFHETKWVKADLIENIFTILTFGALIFSIYQSIKYLTTRNELTVNALTEDLSKRSIGSMTDKPETKE